MTEPRSPEDILMAIVNGDLDPNDERARELLDRDPAAREKLEELQGVVETLDAAARLEREVLADAEGLEEAPGVADVERILQMQQEPRIVKGPSDAPGGRRGFLMAAAAVVLMAFVGWYAFFPPTPSGPEDDDGTLDGDPRIELVRPLGPGQTYDRFEWTEDHTVRPGDGFARVRVYDSGGALLDESDDLFETYWEPKAADHSQWTDAIQWEVVIYSLGRTSLTTSKPGQASR